MNERQRRLVGQVPSRDLEIAQRHEIDTLAFRFVLMLGALIAVMVLQPAFVVFNSAITVVLFVALVAGMVYNRDQAVDMKSAHNRTRAYLEFNK